MQGHTLNRQSHVNHTSIPPSSPMQGTTCRVSSDNDNLVRDGGCTLTAYAVCCVSPPVPPQPQFASRWNARHLVPATACAGGLTTSAQVVACLCNWVAPCCVHATHHIPGMNPLLLLVAYRGTFGLEPVVPPRVRRPGRRPAVWQLARGRAAPVSVCAARLERRFSGGAVGTSAVCVRSRSVVWSVKHSA